MTQSYLRTITLMTFLDDKHVIYKHIPGLLEIKGARHRSNNSGRQKRLASGSISQMLQGSSNA